MAEGRNAMHSTLLYFYYLSLIGPKRAATIPSLRQGQRHEKKMSIKRKLGIFEHFHSNDIHGWTQKCPFAIISVAEIDSES